ncbi:sigma-70 family RNA polymerase sigma factor [Patescibacteria group bacterium]|nr:sigma-70 family RNA polymerase sigma factor [Patescibacteria group bacterium]
MRSPRKKFAKIYNKYIDKIYRFVFLKVESQEIAEDLTSLVFTKGWRKFKKGEKIENPSAYLYQIARAEIANHHRGKAKFKIISAESAQIADTNPSLEENQQLQSELEILKKSLTELRDDYQNVIIWRYLDGLSIKSIAQIMEKPKGTVRVMIHRALKELRGKMSD